MFVTNTCGGQLKIPCKGTKELLEITNLFCLYMTHNLD